MDEVLKRIMFSTVVLFLFLSCRNEALPPQERLFYRMEENGNRLVIDRDRWIRIGADGVIVDKLSGSGDPKVYKIKRAHHNDYPQIFIHVYRQSDYRSYSKGKPHWSKPDTWPMLAFDFWKHKDMPLWHYMDRGNYLIDSADAPEYAGYFRRPDRNEGEGLNDTVFYREYESPARASGPKRVIFDSDHRNDFPTLSAEEFAARTGYLDQGAVSFGYRFILLPISPDHRQFDLAVMLGRSDYGEFARLIVVDSNRGDYVDREGFELDMTVETLLDDGTILYDRTRGKFVVYDDYSVLVEFWNEVGDKPKLLWEWHMDTYRVNMNGLLQKTAINGGKRMKIDYQPSDEWAQAPLDFLRWYRDNYETVASLDPLSYRKDGSYCVDRDKAEGYVELFRSSGFLSDNLLEEWRSGFDRWEKYYDDIRIDDGPPVGFDCDPILLTHDFDEAFESISDGMLITRAALTRGNSAQVTVSLSSRKLTYHLLRIGERWMIDHYE